MTYIIAFLPLLLAADDGPPQLNALGGTIMGCSIAAVLTLVGFCLYRVLTLTPPDMEELQGPLKIDTRDTTDAD